MFKVYATTPEKLSPGEMAAHALRAEAMGYDGLSVPDAIHDGFLLAAMALNATQRIRVMTGVLVAFARSPMTVAISAWDLQRMSGGRFELGLGSQVKANIEKRYNMPWSAPALRMREYVAALRAIFDSFQQGSPLNFVGEQYQFTKLQPFFNPGPIDHPDLPIMMGGIGPLMTSLAGEVSDGLITHPTNTPPRYIREVVLPRLQKGADKAGRDTSDVQLVLGGLVAAARDDKRLAIEREKQRGLLGFLFSTPAYWPSLALFGWQEKGEALLQMTREGRWQEMNAVIDDEMLEQFVPCACYDDIADRMKRRYGGLSTTINFPLPDDPADDKLAAQAIKRLQCG